MLTTSEVLSIFANHPKYLVKVGNDAGFLYYP